MHADLNIPSLETERLLLRQLHPDDLDDIYLLFSNPNVMKYDGGVTLTNRQQAEQYLYTIGHPLLYKNKQGITWAFIEKKTAKFVGTGGIRNWHGRSFAEVGLVIAEEHWNKKYGSEAMQKIIEFAFRTLKLDFVYAATLPENLPARRLVERLDFQFQGWAQQYLLVNQHVPAMLFIKENPENKKVG